MFERSSHWRPPVILIAAGAFKHSLTAAAACGAIARGLRASPLTPMLLEFPIADGGNGTLDAFLRHGGERITINVRGPLGAPVDAAFGILPDGETGIIEMALASGLELVRELDAGRASTYGTGQLVRAALDQNMKRLIIGLGGSATTDGGAGCLQALGLSLRDASGAEITSGGSGLEQLASIDASRLDSRLHNTEIIIAADVDNPAVGPKGAAAVFGPQKGASSADIQQLDRALSHWFNLTYRTTGIDVVAKAGGRIVNLDVTIVCEAPRIGPHVAAMQGIIGETLGIATSRIAIKATTSERLGFTGREEGIVAMASASVEVPRID